MTAIALLALETLGLIIGALVILTFVGSGLTLLLVRDDRWSLLLAPAVGVGFLTIGFQFLNYLMPPHLVALVMLGLGGALTVVVVLRRPPPGPAFRDIGAALALTIAFSLALMMIVIPHGFFTLGSFPSDNIFIYTQAGQYLKDHSSPLLSGTGDLMNTGAFVVAVTGWSLPNSKGVFDASASVLTGLPVYAVFDLVNGVAIATTIGPVWYFVRSALGSSWGAAMLATLLMVSSQLLYWVQGNGFQQESVATPIFTAGLAVTAVAFSRRSARAGLLAGILGGSLLGLYFPIAVIFGALAAFCLGVHLLVDREQRLRLWRPVVWAVAGGVGAGAAALFALGNRGFALWLSQFHGERVTGGISSFPIPLYILGQLSFAHRWEPFSLPYSLVDKVLLPVLLLVSVLFILLMFLGSWQQMREHHAPEAAILVAGMLGVLYEVAIADFAYGYVKAITYVEPFICVAIAVGTLAVARWFVRRSPARWGRPAAALLVVALLGSGVVNSVEMVKAFVDIGPVMTADALRNARLASEIPARSQVLVYVPAATYRDLVRAATAVYFMPDRNVRVYSGDERIGTFLHQDQEPPACAFDYVVSGIEPQGDFSMIDVDVGNGFSVFRRNGDPCPLTG